jgi:hypothetical protein
MLKRGEVLKPFLVPRFHIWKFTIQREVREEGSNPGSGKDYHVFIFATDYQISNRREFLQTPSHSSGKEFITSIDFNIYNIGRQTPSGNDSTLGQFHI